MSIRQHVISRLVAISPQTCGGGEVPCLSRRNIVRLQNLVDPWKAYWFTRLQGPPSIANSLYRRLRNDSRMYTSSDERHPHVSVPGQRVAVFMGPRNGGTTTIFAHALFMLGIVHPRSSGLDLGRRGENASFLWARLHRYDHPSKFWPEVSCQSYRNIIIPSNVPTLIDSGRMSHAWLAAAARASVIVLCLSNSVDARNLGEFHKALDQNLLPHRGEIRLLVYSAVEDRPVPDRSTLSSMYGVPESRIYLVPHVPNLPATTAQMRLIWNDDRDGEQRMRAFDTLYRLCGEVIEALVKGPDQPDFRLRDLLIEATGDGTLATAGVPIPSHEHSKHGEGKDGPSARCRARIRKYFEGEGNCSTVAPPTPSLFGAHPGDDKARHHVHSVPVFLFSEEVDALKHLTMNPRIPVSVAIRDAIYRLDQIVGTAPDLNELDPPVRRRWKKDSPALHRYNLRVDSDTYELIEKLRMPLALKRGALIQWAIRLSNKQRRDA